jgi:hypothetical protein
MSGEMTGEIVRLCIFCKNFGSFDCGELREQWHYRCGFEFQFITPAEYKFRTGNEYPKECAVYLLDGETGWLRVVLYGDMCSAAKEASDKNIPYESIEVYCVFPLVTLKDKGAGK